MERWVDTLGILIRRQEVSFSELPCVVDQKVLKLEFLWYVLR